MERHLIRHLLISAGLLCALLFSSCSVLEPYFAVIQGNYAFNVGDYQAALVHYHKAEQFSEFAPWVRYNLGNLYKSLGEQDVALRMWSSVEASGHPDILFGINYNRGIIYYEQGKFYLAYGSFLDALSIAPSSVEAKVNLELSLEKLRALQQVVTQHQREDSEESLDAESERILTYIKRKEAIQWVSHFQEQEGGFLRDW